MTALPPPDSFELLSAYLDGELTQAEQVHVQELLSTSPAHRDELARVEQARAWVRALPLVEPPDGFLERAMASVANAAPAAPKKHKWGMLNLVATAAVWVLVLGFVNMSRSQHVSPDTAAFAQTHTEASAGIGGFLGSLGAGQPEPQPPREYDLGEPYWAPLSLPNQLSLRQVQINGDLVGLLYSNNSDLVMLYEEPGKLDMSKVANAQPVSIQGNQGWMVQTDNALVLIVERNDLVYAVVGPLDGHLAQAVADKLPSPPSPSLVDRLGDAGRGLLGSFGLG
jgi:hypothetical protein